MAGSATNLLENKLLDHALGVTAFTMPTTLHVALFTGSAAANLEQNITTDEVSGTGYARVPVTFTAAVAGSSSNSAAVQFAAAGSDFGTITSIAVMTDATGGDAIFHGELASSKIIQTGDVFVINTGNLTITLA